MSLPYVYTPRPGEYVRVSRDEDGRCLIATYAEQCGHQTEARILPDEVPGVAAGIAAAMHEAAGLPGPVILGVPTLPVGICHYADGVKVFADGAKVRLQATESHSAKEYWRTKLEPASARKLAANIAALADFIDAQPNPAEVEELTGFLVSAGAGLRTTGVDDIARAALQWFRDKRQRGEEP